jgi:hypothetical protein
MSDSLRVCLIVILSLSVFQAPGLYIFEGYLHGYTFDGILTTFILFITQIILIIILCSTKNVKTLIIFLIILTSLLYLIGKNFLKNVFENFLVFILISFIMKIVSLSNFIENGRQMFYQLMKEYPRGERPNDNRLLLYHIAIKDERCCGIDTNSHLPPTEMQYFYLNFLKNCFIIGPRSPDRQHRYQ